MSYSRFFVQKEFGTLSDVCEALGLAFIIQQILYRNDKESDEILIEDKGNYFEIKSGFPITEEMLSCGFFNFFPYIKGKKDEVLKNENINFINYEDEKKSKEKVKEASEIYFNLPKEERIKNEDKKPVFNTDFDLIKNFAFPKAYKDSFNYLYELKSHFPQFLHNILNYYSVMDNSKFEFAQEVEKITKTFKINALQILNPSQGKGLNKSKASGISVSGQKQNWLKQTLRFTGAWKCLVFKDIKVSSTSWDQKNYCLYPKKISFSQFVSLQKNFKKKFKNTTSIKLDIFSILLITKELIIYDIRNEDIDEFFPPNDKVLGIEVVYLKDLGQNKAVSNIGFICLPNFVYFTCKHEGDNWINVINEHLEIMRHRVKAKEVFDESHSDVTPILQKYRQFISTGDFNKFWEFTFLFTEFAIKEIDKKEYIKTFTINNMEVLMNSQTNCSEILQNEGFREVAKAIRNSTISPILHNNKKDVKFGLSLKIKNASRTKEELIIELSNFIQKYNEEIMLKDYKKEKSHPSYVTTEHFEKFCQLFDNKNYSAKLIGGMLVAFGYAKEPSKNQIQGEN